MKNPRHPTLCDLLNKPRFFSPGRIGTFLHRQVCASAIWLTLALVLAGAFDRLRAQQDELPAGSSNAVPVPMPSPPLGAGAGVGASPTQPKLPSPPLPAAADGSSPLPAAGSNNAAGTTASPGDSGSAALFGGGPDNGKSILPGSTRRVPYSFSLSVGAIYDDNPFLSQQGPRNGKGGADVYFTLAPSFVFGLDNLVSARGNYVHFTYSPVVSLYVRDSENDSVQHLIGLEAQYTFGRFSVTGRESIQILDGTDTAAVNPGPGAILLPGQTTGSTPVYSTGTINQVNLDVGGRSELDSYDTSLNVGFSYSDKLSLGGGLEYSVSDYSNLISSQNLNGSLSADYVYSLKTVIGVGLSGGRSFVQSPSPSQSFVEPNLRISYRYSDKLSFAGSGGVEFLQSDDRSGLQATPVFSLSGSYRPSEITSLSLSASRSEQNSAVLVAQNYETSAITLNLQHTINGRLAATLMLGYENSTYVSEGRNISASRDENYFTVQPVLSVQLRPGLSVSIFYLHRQSSSAGSSGRSFNDDQIGVSTGFSF